MALENTNINLRLTVSRWLKAEMAKRDLTYGELQSRLARLGVNQSEANLRNKVKNGVLGADLFLALVLAMGLESLRLGEFREILAMLEGPPRD